MILTCGHLECHLKYFLLTTLYFVLVSIVTQIFILCAVFNSKILTKLKYILFYLHDHVGIVHQVVKTNS